MFKLSIIPKFCWIIAGLLLAVTLINYVDRLAVSVLIKNISEEFNLNEKDYGQILALFMVAYAIMYAGSGVMVDWLGTRWGMAFFVCFWSVCQVLHGLTVGKWSFAVCRFGLGLAEPGSFPAATKAINEWFPANQRALGIGIFNVGSVAGAALASPLVAFIGLHFGWRAAFIFTGLLGFLWLILWLIFYRPPQNLELAIGSPSAATPMTNTESGRFGILASQPGLALVLARFLTDPVIYFVMFWFPAYLEKERGFDLKMIGQYTWIPWAVGGLGYIFGGWLSGRMLRAGWNVGKARKTAMLVGVMLLPGMILAPLASSGAWAIAIMCVVVLGHAIWVTNLMTLPADLFPADKVATAAGFSGMGGAIAGALANWYTGSVVAHFSYLPIFIAAGLLHPCAMILIWKLLPERFFQTASHRVSQNVN